MSHTTNVSRTKASARHWRVRPRFTLRTLLVAVVVIAVVLAYWKRADGLKRLAAKHAKKAQEYADVGWGLQRFGLPSPERDAQTGQYWRLHEQHRDFSTRCQEAVWRPWVSIRNEPPLQHEPARE